MKPVCHQQTQTSLGNGEAVEDLNAEPGRDDANP